MTRETGRGGSKGWERWQEKRYWGVLSKRKGERREEG
jgi:hypothetical protein